MKAILIILIRLKRKIKFEYNLMRLIKITRENFKWHNNNNNNNVFIHQLKKHIRCYNKKYAKIQEQRKKGYTKNFKGFKSLNIMQQSYT